MPSEKRHRVQATHNENLLNFLAENNTQKTYSDWFVTISFYSAVHIFEAFLDKYCKKKSLNVNSFKTKQRDSSKLKRMYTTNTEHAVRLRLMKDNQDIFKYIYAPFQNLYEMSNARYDCHSPQSHNFVDSEKYHDTVKKEFKKLLSPPKN